MFSLMVLWYLPDSRTREKMGNVPTSDFFLVSLFAYSLDYKNRTKTKQKLSSKTNENQLYLFSPNLRVNLEFTIRLLH